TNEGKTQAQKSQDVNNVSQRRVKHLTLWNIVENKGFELPVSFFPDITIGWSFQGEFAAISTLNYEWVEGQKKQKSEIYLLNTQTKNLTQVSNGISVT